MSEECGWFGWSLDSAEPFTGHLPSRQAAIEAAFKVAKEEEPQMKCTDVWTARCEVPEFPFRFDWEWEVERAHDFLADNSNLGEEVVGWPKVEREKREEIEKEVVELLKQKMILLGQWPPKFWTTEDTKLHFVQQRPDGSLSLSRDP